MTRRLALLTLAAGMALLTGLAGGGPADAAYPGASGKIAWLGGAGSDYGIWAMNADGSDKTRLVGQGDESYPVWSPDGRKIAFSRSGILPSGCTYGEIYVMNADGSGLTEITGGSAATEEDPTWSPDGQKLAYTRYRQDERCQPADWGIWVMNADGSGQTQLTSGGSTITDSQPAWSPDGRKIAFRSDRENEEGNRYDEIYTMNPDGSQVTRLTNTEFSNPEGNTSPAWSPDGQKIAFVHIYWLSSYHEIWVMNADGSGETSVARNGSGPNIEPAWSPDGRKIVFSGRGILCEANCNEEIYSINVDGTGQSQLTDNTISDRAPDWQPLGATTPLPRANGKITWISPTEPTGFGTWDVWTMNADGSEPTNILPGGGLDEEHPAWSPDGRRIAFARVTGSPSGCSVGDIYVMDADGSNVAQLTTNSLGTTANQPTWSPNGTRIAFARGQQDATCNDGDSEIWVMNADGTGQTAVTSGGIGVYNGDSEPDWSPDGTRIAFTGHRPVANGNQLFGIFTVNPSGSQLTRLTGDPISFITTHSPAWSPDGQRIAYEQQDHFDGSDEIWMMNADGSGHTAVTRNGFLTNWSPTWSPDGRQIAFSAQDDQITFDNEIFVINVDGTGQTAITNNTTGDSFPDWQPVPAAEEPPTLTDTDPDSPADDNTPRIKGSAPGAVTVTLYTSPDCSGAQAAEGTAADFASPGLQVTVPDNSSTTFRATATNAAGDVSACSSSSIGYVEDTPPPLETGRVVINLDAVPDDPHDFDFDLPQAFSLDDDADPTLPSSRQFELAAGTRVFRLPGEAGWAITEISCSDPDNGTMTTLFGHDAIVDLDAGETVTCTFTVTKQAGTVVIALDAAPDGPQDFEFSSSGGPGLLILPFSLDDDGDGTLPSSLTFGDLAPGSYGFTQTVPAGWDLTELSCTDPDAGSSTSLATATATIDVDAGETVTCTFTDTAEPPPPPPGTVVINLDAVPDGPQDFEFSSSGGPGLLILPFSLDDDGDGTLPSSITFGDLAPGSYGFTQTLAAGWDLTGLSCTDPDSGSSTSLATATTTIDVDAGETVTCTFTNRAQPGIVRIVTDAVPDAKRDFLFTGSGGIPDFVLDDDQSFKSPSSTPSQRTFGGLTAGEYDIRENAPGSGFYLTELTCDDPDGGSTVSVATRRTVIDLDPGETVVCTFTNSQTTLVIVKDAVPDATRDFSFTGSGEIPDFDLDDDGTLRNPSSLSNQRVFAGIDPGAYQVREALVGGWLLIGLTCDDPDGGSTVSVPDRRAVIDLDPGERILCTFRSERVG